LPTLPPPRTFTITAADGGGSWCAGAASDGAGNIYLKGYVRDVRNIAGGAVYGNTLYQPLAEGFTAFHHQMSPSTTYSAYAPDGRQISSVNVFAYTTLAGVQANGGTILVGCGTNKAAEARKFDDRGALTTVQLTDQDCLSAEHADVLVDQQDRILIVRAPDFRASGPSGRYAARWFDAEGMPLTGWFDAGAVTLGGLTLRPLIGGGAVLRVAFTEVAEWRAAFVSGTANVGPAPAFLPPNTDLAIVRGGKAYAVLSSSSYNHPVGSVAIFAPGGKSCGTLATNGAKQSFYIGKDGTLIDQAGADFAYNDCVTTWYPQVLK
jgi:hypothetical protein